MKKRGKQEGGTGQKKKDETLDHRNVARNLAGWRRLKSTPRKKQRAGENGGKEGKKQKQKAPLQYNGAKVQPSRRSKTEGQNQWIKRTKKKLGKKTKSQAWKQISKRGQTEESETHKTNLSRSNTARLREGEAPQKEELTAGTSSGFD